MSPKRWLSWAEYRWRSARFGAIVSLSFWDKEQADRWLASKGLVSSKKVTNPMNQRYHVWITKR